MPTALDASTAPAPVLAQPDMVDCLAWWVGVDLSVLVRHVAREWRAATERLWGGRARWAGPELWADSVERLAWAESIGCDLDGRSILHTAVLRGASDIVYAALPRYEWDDELVRVAAQADQLELVRALTRGAEPGGPRGETHDLWAAGPQVRAWAVANGWSSDFFDEAHDFRRVLGRVVRPPAGSVVVVAAPWAVEGTARVSAPWTGANRYEIPIGPRIPDLCHSFRPTFPGDRVASFVLAGTQYPARPGRVWLTNRMIRVAVIVECRQDGADGADGADAAARRAALGDAGNVGVEFAEVIASKGVMLPYQDNASDGTYLYNRGRQSRYIRNDICPPGQIGPLGRIGPQSLRRVPTSVLGVPLFPVAITHGFMARVERMHHLFRPDMSLDMLLLYAIVTLPVEAVYARFVVPVDHGRAAIETSGFCLDIEAVGPSTHLRFMVDGMPVELPAVVEPGQAWVETDAASVVVRRGLFSTAVHPNVVPPHAPPHAPPLVPPGPSNKSKGGPDCR